MEVHRQRCQACGSRTLNNLLVRAPGEPQAVFVRCATCGELVARYVLADYYHHGKGLESFLRSRGGQIAESGRRIADELAEVQRAAIDGFTRALEWLKRQGKEP